MSRSIKKHPGRYATVINRNVRKKEKIEYNRRWRRFVRQNVFDDILPEKHIEVSNLWSMTQDGKYYYVPNEPELKRK